MSALNTARSPLVVARAKRILLSTTNATTILTFTARRTTLIRLQPCVVVKNAATDLTLTVSWTDPDGGADTFNWYNAVSVPVGTSLQQDVLLVVQGGTAVTLTATASTAGNITVSASCMEAE